METIDTKYVGNFMDIASKLYSVNDRKIVKLSHENNSRC